MNLFIRTKPNDCTILTFEWFLDRLTQMIFSELCWKPIDQWSSTLIASWDRQLIRRSRSLFICVVRVLILCCFTLFKSFIFSRSWFILKWFKKWSFKRVPHVIKIIFNSERVREFEIPFNSGFNSRFYKGLTTDSISWIQNHYFPGDY